MADGSKIQWTDATWNPTVGCRIVSPGCTNCYAMRLAARLARMGGKTGAKYTGLTVPSKAGAVWTGAIRLDPDALTQPLRWRKPRRIFVNSMSDLFAEDLPDEAIDRVFAVMALCPQHTFQVLTKRAKRMRAYLSAARAHPVGLEAMAQTLRSMSENPRSKVGAGCVLQGDIAHLKIWPLPNVWLGVSAEDQPRADERIPELLKTPAGVRFVSAEPLLGPLDLKQFLWAKNIATCRYETRRCLGRPALDWVIVGGESGPRARPMEEEWAESLRDQCRASGVAFFMKQMAKKAPIPGHLMIREFPHDGDDDELPKMTDLFGIAPNATDGVPSETFVRKIRDDWR